MARRLITTSHQGLSRHSGSGALSSLAFRIRQRIETLTRLLFANGTQCDDRRDLLSSWRRFFVLPVVDRLHADAKEAGELGRREA